MRRLVLVGVIGVVVIGGCDDGGDTGAATGEAPGIGGSEVSAGGGSGGDGQMVPGAGGVPSGGQGAKGGAAGGGDECNEFGFWYTVTEAAVSRLGECGPSSELCSRTSPWGVVVFDSEGRATDITGIEPAREEEWLQDIAGERWPCLADQTVEYCCLPEG